MLAKFSEFILKNNNLYFFLANFRAVAPVKLKKGKKLGQGLIFVAKVK